MVKSHFKIAACFFASVIGAGFASGREIVNFFTKYQKMSVYGLFLSGILFFVFTYCLYNLIYINKDKFASFSSLFPKKLVLFYNILSSLLLFSMFCVMIAGLSSAGQNIFSLNSHIFGIICTIILFIIFSTGRQAVIKSSLVISPLMGFGIVFVGIYYLLLSNTSVFNPFAKTSLSWIVSSVAYVSYNSIPLISFFWETKELFTSKSVCFKGAFYGSVCLFFTSVILDFLLKKFYVKINVMDIPMLYISEQIGFVADTISKIILILAMISTALSCGFSLISITERKTKIKRVYCILFYCILGVIVSFAGFSNLVEYVYPFFGYSGFIFLIYIIIKYIKGVKKYHI